MKDVFISQSKNPKHIIPKTKEDKLKEKQDEAEKKDREEVEPLAQEEKKDEFSVELKKGTDEILKKLLKEKGNGPLTYKNFDKEVISLINNIQNDQDDLKQMQKKQEKEQKKLEKKKKIAELKNKFFGKKS